MWRLTQKVQRKLGLPDHVLLSKQSPKHGLFCKQPTSSAFASWLQNQKQHIIMGTTFDKYFVTKLWSQSNYSNIRDNR